MRTRIVDPDCPFCEILAGEDHDARIVMRREGVVAFFPTEPATLGHTLVVPESHVADIWQIDAVSVSKLGSATVELAHAIRRAIRPDGLNIIQSNGAAATQTVMHLHVHLVPRWDDDDVGPIWPPETDYSEASKDAAWQRLREEFLKL